MATDVRLEGRPFQGMLARVQHSLLIAAARVNHAMTFGPNAAMSLSQAVEHAEHAARVLREAQRRVRAGHIAEGDPPPPPDIRLGDRE